MSHNRQQTHMESRWLKHVFLPLEGFLCKAKYREEGRQYAIINRTNEVSQKTQRGKWGYANLNTRRRNKTQNLPHWVPHSTLIQQANNAGGTSPFPTAQPVGLM